MSADNPIHRTPPSPAVIVARKSVRNQPDRITNTIVPLKHAANRATYEIPLSAGLSRIVEQLVGGTTTLQSIDATTTVTAGLIAQKVVLSTLAVATTIVVAQQKQVNKILAVTSPTTAVLLKNMFVTMAVGSAIAVQLVKTILKPLAVAVSTAVTLTKAFLVTLAATTAQVVSLVTQFLPFTPSGGGSKFGLHISKWWTNRNE